MKTLNTETYKKMISQSKSKYFDLPNITNFEYKELNEKDIIFVEHSGGFDSTYNLIQVLKHCDNEKVFAINSLNPLEINDCVRFFKKLMRSNYIYLKRTSKKKVSEIMQDAFLNIQKGIDLRKDKKKTYYKKIFDCCRILKHQAAINNPLLKLPNSVIVSGQKRADSQQRFYFLSQIANGKIFIGTSKTINNYNLIDKQIKWDKLNKLYPTFYHKHKTGLLKVYPFRDTKDRDLPEKIVNEIRKICKINHSGCRICPVLVLFEDRYKKTFDENDLIRLNMSKKYYLQTLEKFGKKLPNEFKKSFEGFN